MRLDKPTTEAAGEILAESKQRAIGKDRHKSMAMAMSRAADYMAALEIRDQRPAKPAL